jgi:hypothetical protein
MLAGACLNRTILARKTMFKSFSCSLAKCPEPVALIKLVTFVAIASLEFDVHDAG